MDSRYDALKLENQLCFPLYACALDRTSTIVMRIDVFVLLLILKGKHAFFSPLKL